MYLNAGKYLHLLFNVNTQKGKKACEIIMMYVWQKSYNDHFIDNALCLCLHHNSKRNIEHHDRTCYRSVCRCFIYLLSKRQLEHNTGSRVKSPHCNNDPEIQPGSRCHLSLNSLTHPQSHRINNKLLYTCTGLSMSNI